MADTAPAKVDELKPEEDQAQAGSIPSSNPTEDQQKQPQETPQATESAAPDAPAPAPAPPPPPPPPPSSDPSSSILGQHDQGSVPEQAQAARPPSDSSTLRPDEDISAAATIQAASPLKEVQAAAAIAPLEGSLFSDPSSSSSTPSTSAPLPIVPPAPAQPPPLAATTPLPPNGTAQPEQQPEQGPQPPENVGEPSQVPPQDDATKRIAEPVASTSTLPPQSEPTLPSTTSLAPSLPVETSNAPGQDQSILPGVSQPSSSSIDPLASASAPNPGPAPDADTAPVVPTSAPSATDLPAPTAHQIEPSSTASSTDLAPPPPNTDSKASPAGTTFTGASPAAPPSAAGNQQSTTAPSAAPTPTSAFAPSPGQLPEKRGRGRPRGSTSKKSAEPGSTPVSGPTEAGASASASATAIAAGAPSLPTAIQSAQQQSASGSSGTGPGAVAAPGGGSAASANVLAARIHILLQINAELFRLAVMFQQGRIQPRPAVRDEVNARIKDNLNYLAFHAQRAQHLQQHPEVDPSTLLPSQPALPSISAPTALTEDSSIEPVMGPSKGKVAALYARLATLFGSGAATGSEEAAEREASAVLGEMEVDSNTSASGSAGLNAVGVGMPGVAPTGQAPLVGQKRTADEAALGTGPFVNGAGGLVAAGSPAAQRPRLDPGPAQMQPSNAMPPAMTSAPTAAGLGVGMLPPAPPGYLNSGFPPTSGAVGAAPAGSAVGASAPNSAVSLPSPVAIGGTPVAGVPPPGPGGMALTVPMALPNIPGSNQPPASNLSLEQAQQLIRLCGPNALSNLNMLKSHYAAVANATVMNGNGAPPAPGQGFSPFIMHMEKTVAGFRKMGLPQQLSHMHAVQQMIAKQHQARMANNLQAAGAPGAMPGMPPGSAPGAAATTAGAGIALGTPGQPQTMESNPMQQQQQPSAMQGGIGSLPPGTMGVGVPMAGSPAHALMNGMMGMGFMGMPGAAGGSAATSQPQQQSGSTPAAAGSPQGVAGPSRSASMGFQSPRASIHTVGGPGSTVADSPGPGGRPHTPAQRVGTPLGPGAPGSGNMTLPSHPQGGAVGTPTMRARQMSGSMSATGGPATPDGSVHSQNPQQQQQQTGSMMPPAIYQGLMQHANQQQQQQQQPQQQRIPSANSARGPTPVNNAGPGTPHFVSTPNNALGSGGANHVGTPNSAQSAPNSAVGGPPTSAPMGTPMPFNMGGHNQGQQQQQQQQQQQMPNTSGVGGQGGINVAMGGGMNMPLNMMGMGAAGMNMPMGVPASLQQQQQQQAMAAAAAAKQNFMGINPAAFAKNVNSATGQAQQQQQQQFAGMPMPQQGQQAAGLGQLTPQQQQQQMQQQFQQQQQQRFNGTNPQVALNNFGLLNGAGGNHVMSGNNAGGGPGSMFGGMNMGMTSFLDFGGQGQQQQPQQQQAFGQGGGIQPGMLQQQAAGGNNNNANVNNSAANGGGFQPFAGIAGAANLNMFQSGPGGGS